VTVRIILFCEAAADARTATTLIEETLCHRVPWLQDSQGLDTWSDVAVRYHPDEDAGNRPWFDVHRVVAHREELGIKPSRGHFGGQPAKAGAKMLLSIARIVRALRMKAGPDSPIEALVLVWDMDRQGRDRVSGLKQARTDPSMPNDFEVLIGCPDPMREAWVLAGFSPSTAEEQQRLDDERQALGFAPNEHPHRLTASDEAAKKNPKRVVASLLGGVDPERDAECLSVRSPERWELLHTRGRECGLADFLDEIDATLVPRFDGRAAVAAR